MSIYRDIIHWLETHMTSCSWKEKFHIECPGCGFQRSFVALLKGNFAESFAAYPALLPMLLVLLITPLHLIFKFKNGAAIIKYLFILSAIIIALNFILKIKNQNLL